LKTGLIEDPDPRGKGLRHEEAVFTVLCRPSTGPSAEAGKNTRGAKDCGKSNCVKSPPNLERRLSKGTAETASRKLTGRKGKMGRGLAGRSEQPLP